MPKQEVIRLCPFGWENDPEEERFKVSTLDYLTACTYTNFAIFFKLDDADKNKTVGVLVEGLERTISQARHLCGTIEKNPGGGHSFVKKRHSTVQFFVQCLDSPEDNYPFFDDIQKAYFRTSALGDLNLWSVYPMTYGEKPGANPDKSPLVAAFKAS
ncbi:hypothetical protein AAE478_002066 [Parahypoxylon ruwenzoriense]